MSRAHRKPLDTATGRLLTLYLPGGRHGNNQHTDDSKCTLFAGRFDGHRYAAVVYRAHRMMEVIRGFQKSH